MENREEDAGIFYAEQNLPEGKTSEKCVNFTEVPIVIWLPDCVVEVEIRAKIYYEGEIHTAAKKLNTSEVRERIKDAEENYIDPHAEYVLTDLGKKYAEALERGEA